MIRLLFGLPLLLILWVVFGVWGLLAGILLLWRPRRPSLIGVAIRLGVLLLAMVLVLGAVAGHR